MPVVSRAGSGRAPASLRSVLGNPEFRALLSARVLSLTGDQVAKLALALVVYRHSHSAFLAAATFAATFLPWLVSGPVLASFADRWRRRDVMVGCDLARAGLVGALAVPGLPLALVFALLVAVVVLSAPFEAARAALVTEVLRGDAYVVGSSLGQAVGQASQALGYLVGGVLVALLSPPGALGVDAVTFLASAGLALRVRRGTPAAVVLDQPRPVAAAVSGARVVFGDRVLRRLVVVAWVTAGFGVVPEGLAVACAGRLHGAAGTAGLLAAAVPLGALVGSLAVGRLVSPAFRTALIRPLMVVISLPLVVTVLPVGSVGVAIAWGLAGIGFALNVPAMAGFMVRTPAAVRARAFGLAEAGLQATQGVGLLAGGALAQVLPATTVVAVCGVLGVVAAVVLSVRWPAELCRGIVSPPRLPSPPQAALVGSA